MISFFFHLFITSELESTKLATSQSLCGKEAARMEKVFWKLCYQSIAIIIIVNIIVVVRIIINDQGLAVLCRESTV